MSVLTIVQDALDEMGLPYPASIESSTDPTQRQCKRILQASAEFLRSQRIWPQLKKQGSITLVDARYQYPLPSDYFSPLVDTQYHDTNAWRLIGPVMDAEWVDRTKGVAGGYQTAFRIFGPDLNPSSTAGQIKIDPTPTASEAGQTLSYEYLIKSLYVKSDYSSYYETVNDDTDLCLFDSDLMTAEFKWRYLRSKKKEYEQEFNDARAILATAMRRLEGSKIGSMLNKSTGPRYNVPPGGWTF